MCRGTGSAFPDSNLQWYIVASYFVRSSRLYLTVEKLGGRSGLKSAGTTEFESMEELKIERTGARSERGTKDGCLKVREKRGMRRRRRIVALRQEYDFVEVSTEN